MRSNFARTYAKRNKLTPHLEAWFERAEFPDTISFDIHLNKEKDTAFHPSSDSMECLRALYGYRTGQLNSNRISGSLHKIFHVGHMYHAWLQHILVEELGFSTWADIEKEHRCLNDGSVLDVSQNWRTDPLIESSPWWARGYTDVAQCQIPRYGSYLIDIKTVNDFYFRDMPEHVKAKYEVQCQIYMHWHQQEKAMLLLAQKGTPHDFKEIEFTYDPSIIKGVYERWDILAQAIADEVAPDCDCINPSKCPAAEADLARI